MRKWWFREVQAFVQAHTDGKWWSWASGSVS